MVDERNAVRILILTNYYPPSQYGWGYMQLCEEVANGLSKRGHAIAVLTSTYGARESQSHPYPVWRDLQIDPDWNISQSAAIRFFFGRHDRERRSSHALQMVIKNFCPEVIFVWHAIGLSRQMLAEAENSGIPVVYYLAGYLPELPDEYMAYWQSIPQRPLAKWFKRPLARLALAMLRREGRPIQLHYKRVICVSNFVRSYLQKKNLIPDDAVVIYNGIDKDVFCATRQRSFKNRPMRCLLAGRLVPDKGVHTAVEAMVLLKQTGLVNQVQLSILGSGPKDYVTQLHRRVKETELQDQVLFEAPIERSCLPTKMDGYDVLLLPSQYDEPLARSMQEGMAMGLLVVGTVTGGSGELLRDGQTGLTFGAGRADEMADRLRLALEQPEICQRLAQKGQEIVLNHFTIQHTVEAIDNYLQKVLHD